MAVLLYHELTIMIEPKIDWNLLFPTIESKNLVSIMIYVQCCRGEEQCNANSIGIKELSPFGKTEKLMSGFERVL